MFNEIESKHAIHAQCASHLIQRIHQNHSSTITTCEDIDKFLVIQFNIPVDEQKQQCIQSFLSHVTAIYGLHKAQ